MTNSVLLDNSPLSATTEIILELHDGTEIVTRGTAADLGETEGQLEQSYVRAGTVAWCPLPRGMSSGSEVSFVRLPMAGMRFKVLSRNVLGSAAPGAFGFTLELRLTQGEIV